MKSFKHLQDYIRGIAICILLLCATPNVLAFKGSDLASGQNYYLFNIYQAKFLSWGNMWGTQASLDNYRPMKVTITRSGTGYTINTHMEPTASGVVVNASYDNYLLDTEWNSIHWPVVNARYYENNGVTNRDATIWTIAKHKSSGYYQISSTHGYLAYNEMNIHAGTQEGGWACELTKDLSYAPDRSYWQLISESEYAEWTAKKKVTVASLNVDGMPKSVKVAGVYTVNLNDDANEGPGATAIGNRLRDSGFDVVGVSEDFNYHSELWNAAWNNGTGIHYNATTHRGSIGAGMGAMADYLGKKPILDSDGLGLFYRIDGATTFATPSAESWTQWNDHYGYTDSGADGLIRKGYRYYLITLADGTEIDLYTLHMDAEDNAGDNAARESQMAQLVAAIKATHNKRPIIIMGDTNCRYTRDRVKELLIDAINADERFTCRDPWIQFGQSGTYPSHATAAIGTWDNGYLKGEVVDKIFYINNSESDIRLTAETYAQDLSFVWEKEGVVQPLCDHKPCVVTFSYHRYDPAIDDAAVIETSEEEVYLRNRETGRYLMNGGWWGSHAVVGNYAKPMYIKSLPNGKYELASAYGHFTDAGFLDNNTVGEYIAEWTILERDGYKVFTYKQNGVTKALTAKDATFFNDNPLYRYATTAALNTKDKYQQWEIVTQAQLAAEMAMATPTHPVNATHLVKSANFDRIDWAEHGMWVFNNIGGKDRVTDHGIGGIDNDAYCNYNRMVSTKSTKSFGITNSSNKWDCYQVLTVPAGYYLITNQGFEAGTNCTCLYAWSNPEGAYLEKQVALQTKGTLTSDDQTGAGRAFDKGEYVNALPVIKVGSDGVLVIGVKKTDNNSTSGWVCFDNFQLMYLGTTDPEEYEETDGIAIDELPNRPGTKPTETYDLHGRRIKTITRPGIYLRNGKKYIIR